MTGLLADKDAVLDLYADVVPRQALRPVAVALIPLLGLTAPANPFDALVGRGRVEATRLLVAALAAVRDERVCDRCGGTGRYGDLGVCFDCGGRRTVIA